jgi:superfamily II DNA or RNA helicase/ribosomal protein L34
MSHAGRADAVRARIAQSWLARDDAELSVGSFTLRPSQRQAVRAVEQALHDFGGALVADPPGTGKTIIALAVARAAQRVIVVAPSTLREQWQRAATRAEREIEFVSLESLSRGRTVPSAPLVIVDEAHHARTPSTHRYKALAQLCLGARVLLLTATPVVNRASDMHALLALFLGERAERLDAEMLARVVIRRAERELADTTHARRTADLMPRVRRLAPLRVEECPIGVAAAVRALPPPFPAADGAAALALIQISLAMAWGSSLAALDAVLRRRIQRADALADALAAGRWPDRRALAQWIVGDDATQLAMPLLLSEESSPPPANAAVTLRTHVDAVRLLRASLQPFVAPDSAARAAALGALMHAHRGTRVVCFARHADTIVALWRALRGTAGVVAITGERVRAAHGRWSRDEVLRALGPRAKPLRSDDPRAIRLLLTTDLLAEGVELQGVGIIVHGDGAWNPARFEQRTGRIARIGGAREVLETHFAMPAGAEGLVHLRERLQRKSEARDHAVRDAWAREQLETRLASWASDGTSRTPSTAASRLPSARIACVSSVTAGFLALIRTGDALTLIGARRHRGRWRLTTAPEQLRHLAACAEGAAHPLSEGRVLEVRRLLARWCARRAARALIGDGTGDAAATRVARGEVDRLLSRSSLSGRSAIAESGAQALSIVARAQGVGAGRALRKLPAGESYLAELTHLARDIATRQLDERTPTMVQSRLVALLLLEPDDPTVVERAITPRCAAPISARARAR